MKKRRRKSEGGIGEFLKDKQTLLMVGLVIISIVAISAIGIEQGLDLKGGASVQLALEHPVDKTTMEQVTTVLDKRLNIYGVKDVKVRSSGNNYVIVEMAGATAEEVERLIGNPGKFEAKIDNVTVLTGSDIASVSMYEITGDSWMVPFTTTPDGAKNFAKLAKGKAGEEVYMYLDGQLINNDSEQPKLDAGLANGEPVTDVSVSGGADSRDQAESEAKEVYTVLKTGSLPVKVHVVGSNEVSPELGSKFLNGAILAGLLAIIAISAIVFIRYRRPLLAIPIIITSISEVLIVMGIASVIHWNIDLAAIVGLIASLGTGVDDQIIITDEVLNSGETVEKRRRARTRLSVRNALFIIFASAGTLIAAMLPLVYVGFARGASGIGVLSGFAFTTILGVLVGVLITRPVYAKFVELFLKH